MKKLHKNNGYESSAKISLIGLLIMLVMILGLSVVSAAEAQVITSKPDNLKAFVNQYNAIEIVADKEIKKIELWTSKTKKLSAKVNKNSIILNALRLKEGLYEIKVFHKDTLVTIKFKK